MTPAPKIRVAITDDHQIVIDGLTAALKQFPHIEIVCTATSGEKMLAGLQHCKPNVLLTDVMMPGIDGEELARLVQEQFPNVRIIALSMNNVGEQIERMAPYIDGYLLKQCSVQELVNAIEVVQKGGSYFESSVQQARLHHRRSVQSISDTGITPREKQIITLIEGNCSNKEISDRLCISIRTVETHRRNILRKTGTSNALALIQWAYAQKML